MTTERTSSRLTMRAVRGFTLVELMIAMAVGLIVLLALSTVFVNSSQNRRELDNSAMMLENGRFAMQILRDELQAAGFYDALNNPPAPTDPATIPDIPCDDSMDILRQSLGLAVLGVNGGGFTCANSSTGALFIQRAATQTTPADARVSARPYLQVSFCGETYEASPFVLDLGNATTFALRQIDCDPANLAPTRELLRRIFFIRNSGAGVPTLMRRNATGLVDPLVEGIEAMRFEFALDNDDDGSPDATSESPAGADWLNVVGVRIWLLARALQPTPGYERTGPQKTFPGFFPNSTPAGTPPADNFKRHVFTSYVELANPAGRRQR